MNMRYVPREEDILIDNEELMNKDYDSNNGLLEEIVLARKVICEQNNEIEKLNKVIMKQGNEITTEVNSNLIMKKALQSQEEFIVNISHELKTPLNVLSSSVQLFSLYSNSGSLDKMRISIIKYISSMKQNCYRLSKLINNIVDSSKIETGFFELHLSNNNIVEVVEDITLSVTDFTDSKGLNIIFDTDTEEKIIACDPEKIERVVLNLLSNAIKFSDKGDEIFISVKDKNKFVEILVEDNGIGIEEKNLDTIFDRFKQIDKSLSRNAGGTGIGLSLVKSIVELHNGCIYAESEVGKGSKFIVTLPSRNVSHENVILSNKISSKNENTRVELSDIYL
ncbi:sensor histidine kinase [Clostridium lacusfryxellense]|uniref:sensor histidine kinase n=1 Tax=Clostridium lacusfryxellense TaxID=205328 RepID=UPI001C0C7727|nr:HAMP domain-containing sensor histidine kinase [Clostridium lacusfryxellense]MBU3114532.1 HAMP domain-containing histidine kinase [Clostridium lacusfryxellense]